MIRLTAERLSPPAEMRRAAERIAATVDARDRQRSA
jgi:hypothetical protein